MKDSKYDYPTIFEKLWGTVPGIRTLAAGQFLDDVRRDMATVESLIDGAPEALEAWNRLCSLIDVQTAMPLGEDSSVQGAHVAVDEPPAPEFRQAVRKMQAFVTVEAVDQLAAHLTELQDLDATLDGAIASLRQRHSVASSGAVPPVSGEEPKSPGATLAPESMPPTLPTRPISVKVRMEFHGEVTDDMEDEIIALLGQHLRSTLSIRDLKGSRLKLAYRGGAKMTVTYTDVPSDKKR